MIPDRKLNMLQYSKGSKMGNLIDHPEKNENLVLPKQRKGRTRVELPGHTHSYTERKCPTMDEQEREME